MTKEQKLQAIRVKCIEANPDLKWEDGHEELELNFTDTIGAELLNIPHGNYYEADRYDDDFTHILHLWKDNKSYDIKIPKDVLTRKKDARPIRLADVLLAIDLISREKIEKVTGMTKYQTLHAVGKIVELYNLRKDDLTEQSDETIDFIHSLLCV